METTKEDFYSLFLAILCRIQRIDSRFSSLSLLRTTLCNEYLKHHPELSALEVLKLYYESLQKACLEGNIICHDGVYQFNSLNIKAVDERTRKLAYEYAEKMIH